MPLSENETVPIGHSLFKPVYLESLQKFYNPAVAPIGEGRRRPNIFETEMHPRSRRPEFPLH